MSIQKRCDTCRFVGEQLIRDVDGPVRVCRRLAPRAHIIDDDPFAIWPRVEEDDWCGEWLGKSF